MTTTPNGPADDPAITPAGDPNAPNPILPDDPTDPTAPAVDPEGASEGGAVVDSHETDQGVVPD